MIFKWLNESEIMIEGDKIEIFAPAKTDFFCGSTDECEEGFYRNHFVTHLTIIRR